MSSQMQPFEQPLNFMQQILLEKRQQKSSIQSTKKMHPIIEIRNQAKWMMDQHGWSQLSVLANISTIQDLFQFIECTIRCPSDHWILSKDHVVKILEDHPEIKYIVFFTVNNQDYVQTHPQNKLLFSQFTPSSESKKEAHSFLPPSLAHFQSEVFFLPAKSFQKYRDICSFC